MDSRGTLGSPIASPPSNNPGKRRGQRNHPYYREEQTFTQPPSTPYALRCLLNRLTDLENPAGDVS